MLAASREETRLAMSDHRPARCCSKIHVPRPLLNVDCPLADGGVVNDLTQLELNLEDGVAAHDAPEVVEYSPIVTYLCK
jgi:hypothetical protein